LVLACETVVVVFWGCQNRFRRYQVVIFILAFWGCETIF
jgi:hypothetical protein